MADVPQRFDHIRRRSLVGRWLGSLGLIALAGVGVLTLVGKTGGGTGQVVAGLTILGGGLLTASAVIFLWSLIDLVLKIEASTFRMYDVLRDLQANVQEHTRQLNVISENSVLSDMARSITHRVKERNALRLAINEEIIKGDYEAANALVEQLASRHGYKNEAARLREEVDQSHTREQDEKVHEAVQRVHVHLEAQHWDAARRDMDRLLAQYPNNTEVRGLPKAFGQARDVQKRRLLKEWDESVQRNEVDRGIALLKELDQYLTPNEAAALEESARGVFRAKLHNMGVQFSLAVSEGNWPGALEVGKEIVAEFPNSRMAQEVRERMHVLVKRAQESPLESAMAQA
ncbi:MAG: hypothetical protein HZA51_02755 [Planctomycetes bacterium]|nr:hypothetical protein [Planctomycetota bacterium]